MVRVLGPTEYKVVARLIRARKRAPPPIVIPTAPSVPSWSKLSRYGLARAKHIERLVRGPPLTAPCARRPCPCCGSGRRNGLSDRTKKLTKEDMRCTAELLDKRSPIQGPERWICPSPHISPAQHDVGCIRRGKKVS